MARSFFLNIMILVLLNEKKGMYMIMDRFTNKVALVTGGARGIGKSSAERLCMEGARVVVADYNAEGVYQTVADFREQGFVADALVFNATDVDNCKRIVQKTIALHGKIDVLVNVVGGNDLNRDKAVGELDIDYFDEIFHLNVRSMLVSIQTALPDMIKQGGGSIVNIASMSGVTGDFRGTLYGMCKAGVISLTRYVATQYGKAGIRCNAVAPGLVVTPAVELSLPEVYKTLFLKHNSLAYLGRPEHIASTVAFLASDDAAYINGQTILADGGMTCHNPTVGDMMEVFGSKS